MKDFTEENDMSDVNAEREWQKWLDSTGMANIVPNDGHARRAFDAGFTAQAAKHEAEVKGLQEALLQVRNCGECLECSNIAEEAIADVLDAAKEVK